MGVAPCPWRPVSRVFLNHARLALMQIEVACDAARATERPEKPGFVIGFLLGQEATRGAHRRPGF